MWGEGTQAIVAECEGKGCGEGDRANTPHISQLKTKPELACCSVNACPGSGQAGQLTTSVLTHSNTQGPGTRSGWAQRCTTVHV